MDITNGSDIWNFIIREHGELKLYFTQAFTGHGCFKLCIKSFKIWDDKCDFCNVEVDNAEHT